MEIIGQVVKWLFVVVSVYSISKSVFTETSLSFTRKVLSNISIKMLIQVVLTMIITICTIGLLYETFSFLRWGWTKAIFGENFNISFTPTHTGNESLNMLIGLPFVVLFAVAVPKLAHFEEKMFRAKTISLPQIIVKSIIFGMIHCIAGIPLAAGIGLSIPGLLLAFAYKKKYLSILNQYDIKTKDAKNFDVSCEETQVLTEKQVLKIIKKADYEATMYSTSYHSIWNWLGAILIILSIVF